MEALGRVMALLKGNAVFSRMSEAKESTLKRLQDMPTHRKLQWGQVAGQLLSYVLVPGGLLAMKRLAPGGMKRNADRLKKYIVLPYIGFLESIVGVFFLDKEEKENWNKIKQRPITERADFIADNMSKYMTGSAISISTSIGAKVATDKILDAPGKWDLIFESTGVDLIARVGSVTVMSTMLSNPANRAKRGFSKILQRLGVEKENADDAAMMSLFVGVPDTAGLLAANWYIGRQGQGKG